MLVLLATHVAVRVWTVAYFAPTIIAFQSMPASPLIDPVLVKRAARWGTLNAVRVMLFMVVNLALLPLILRVGQMLDAGESGKG